MTDVITVGDTGHEVLAALLERFGLDLVVLQAGEDITGSFWGDSEAGIVGRRVFVRGDTPVHSLLHEICHLICMDESRREGLDRDAGGNDLEEAAVCYLQLVLAEQLPGAGRERLMCDMDAWGYSFRLGSTRRWWQEDADDARKWLIEKGLLTVDGEAVFAVTRRGGTLAVRDSGARRRVFETLTSGVAGRLRSGVMVRSRIVAGYPDLKVDAYEEAYDKRRPLPKRMKPLPHDRTSRLATL